ncbi:TIGR02679 domain-containing protein [Cohnella lubricantis]|uniref:DUF2399 domain-containing protein n=1 Tax=Cohnella lubricantis TaxID=2163172 RepID=A0A841T8S5_9BACL|nr:TIGR02679 domain-containing protein [Cohnella lubricantis]MBB6675828.1 DUF2399 domain-containing protein [Cohnella lubricantis]MBP2119761.1 uncharacterized protein (TIGR02679 family) [Cohnella lubricantis]
MSEESGTSRRAAEYFRRKGFQKALHAVWRKYVSLGRIGGQAVLERASEEECEALNAFFGWYYRAGDSIPIPLELFDRELRESAFGIGLLELHFVLEGIPLLTRGERQSGEERQWMRLLAEVRETELNTLGLDTAGARWLREIEQGTGPGLRTLRECYKSDPEAARVALAATARALSLLTDDVGGGGEHRIGAPPIRLPVLAAIISGDAHTLDPGRPAGRLLIAALQQKQGVEGAALESAEESKTVEAVDRQEEIDDVGSESLRLRELYRRAGILDDDLSSIVHWYFPQPGRLPLPTVWTLRQVEAGAESDFPPCSHIYVVENPAVFSTILDVLDTAEEETGGNPAALVCTSGPASAAAIRWMQRCLEVSPPACRVYYSGDFDIKGLAMAQTLQRLLPERFIPWRFDSNAYQEALTRYPGPAFNSDELKRLENMNVSWDSGLCDLMRRTGKKAHQESFIEGLLTDFAGDH